MLGRPWQHDCEHDVVNQGTVASMSRTRFARSIQTIRLVRLAISIFLDSQIATSIVFVQRRQTSLFESHLGGRSRNWLHHLIASKTCQPIMIHAYNKYLKVN